MQLNKRYIFSADNTGTKPDYTQDSNMGHDKILNGSLDIYTCVR